jgi:UDP-N-acetylmuramate--alanine ligase
VRNALATIAVASELQISDQDVINALQNFEGIDRRFQSLGEVRTRNGKVMLVDDYGHHPTEIAATIAAARSGWPEKRIVLAFQPHRYSRTRDLLDDFAAVLSGADGRAIARAVRGRGAVEPVFVETLDELPSALDGLLADGDLLLTMGAGDIGAFAATLPEKLARGPQLKVQK